MLAAPLDFVQRARAGDTLHGALYELGDDELIGAIEAAGKKLHLVLSNPEASDAESGSASGNAASRQRLANTAGQLIDRMLPPNQIGHNKFVVHVDAHGKPAAVLFGSTNRTSTGLCAQTNNTIVCDDAAVARRYLDYWKQLAKDALAAAGKPAALQGAALRARDAKSKTIALAGGARASSWFSPNAAKKRASIAGEKAPPDMAEVAQLIAGAKHAVLLLAFYPGSPSLADWAAAAQKANKDLFVRGCVTHPSAAESFYYDLHGATGARKRQDRRVIQAQALGDNVPAGWQKEILSAGFAVTHDKIVVVDPFLPDCAVVTGGHNPGHRASFNNDETSSSCAASARSPKRMRLTCSTSTITSRGDGRSRAAARRPPTRCCRVVPDEWQSRYFDAQGNIKVAQLRFWLSTLPWS